MGSPQLIHVDYTADENQLKQSAVHILKSVRPQWAEEDQKYMIFTEGITNKLIGCYLSTDVKKEEAIVIRIYGAKTELIIDRERELTNMQILHAAKCAAPCIARFNNGIVYGFVPGVCLDDDNVRTPEIYRCVTKSMAAMHLIDPEKLGLTDKLGDPVTVDHTPVVFTKCRQFLSLIPDNFTDPTKNERMKDGMWTKAELETELDRMEAALTPLNPPICYCHNDLLLKNIVYNKDKGITSFIDYEYGAFNYEAFDLGNHFAEWSGVDEVDFSRYPSKEEQLPWLRIYLEHKAELSGQIEAITDTNIERLYVLVNKFALMAHYLWGVWALVQAEISTIDFDYMEYGKLKLGEYFNKRDEFLALEMPS